MRNNKKYDQIRAMLSITKASLKATFRNPSTIVFGFLFPFVFILAFGFLGNSSPKISVGIENENFKKIKDTEYFKNLVVSDTIEIVKDNPDKLKDSLKKGKLDAIFDVEIDYSESMQYPKIDFDVTTSTASMNGPLFKSIVEGVADKANLAMADDSQQIFSVKERVLDGRKYERIDFILPGQLGFSLLSTGIFGTAFTFLLLRKTLVLKRFFATPISKIGIIVGEMLSRLVFALMQASVIILIGHFFLGFTLVNGIVTFFSMIFLCILALTVFLGFGFVVSGVAKEENTVPAIANLITLPQFLLAGTFFPIESFPTWLQPISRILPLTYLNNALRKVAFEGETIFMVWKEIGILVIWMIVAYSLAIKFFRWED